MSAPICPYCKTQSKFSRLGLRGYPYAKDYGPVYVCVPCAAWVGCHPNSTMPLGRLADAKLRIAKQAAHRAFDPLWHGKHAKSTRGAAYKWLGEKLGLPPAETHIGMFDVPQCEKVVALCNAQDFEDVS